jgi:hypothetical protein
MEKSNSLIRGFYPGLVAGIIGGMVFFLYVIFFSLYGIPDITSFDFWLNYFIYQVGVQGIFGGIFGIIYSKFYDRVPGKGARKGLVFGLIIFLLGNFAYGTWHTIIGLSAGNESHLMTAVNYFSAFLIWFIYGIVLGSIYERWKF